MGSYTHVIYYIFIYRKKKKKNGLKFARSAYCAELYKLVPNNITYVNTHLINKNNAFKK